MMLVFVFTVPLSKHDSTESFYKRYVETTCSPVPPTGLVPFSNSVNMSLMSLKSDANGA